ncbi:alpha/beta-hydrolase [Gonapodya prolifera JEL478]|uniref:Alpha/beta-hydrolase n=1 Tax=Gonapodya prolifera (strain JEL478) TaxID=1344416 RepID=A0A139APE2_GONPJ|nr:alpha/beta-hydrolase [Gonapodya prolifera JEL478]|eukprot:KXS18514.1 alpha/beta-hydrolase [Gonapodya prolifera JEL478]
MDFMDLIAKSPLSTLLLFGGAASVVFWLNRLFIVTSTRSRKPWESWPTRKNSTPPAESGIMVDKWKEGDIEIEVWVKLAQSPSKLPPFVFVHGGFHSAGCFVNYIQFFSSRGIDCYSLSLRGHGTSTVVPGRELFHNADEWCLDVGVVVGRLLGKGTRPPVLFGHSAGGGLVQYFLTHPPSNVRQFSSPLCSAFVHLDGFPPSPYGHRPFLNWSFVDTWNLLVSNATLNNFHMLKTPALARKVFYSKDTPEDVVVDSWSQLERVESIVMPITYAASMFRPFCDTKAVLQACNGKLVVVGAEEDVLMDPMLVSKVVELYETTALELGGKTSRGSQIAVKKVMVRGGHCHMVEPWWQDGAKVVADVLIEALSQGGK